MHPAPAKAVKPRTRHAPRHARRAMLRYARQDPSHVATDHPTDRTATGHPLTGIRTAKSSKPSKPSRQRASAPAVDRFSDTPGRNSDTHAALRFDSYLQAPKTPSFPTHSSTAILRPKQNSDRRDRVTNRCQACEQLILRKLKNSYTYTQSSKLGGKYRCLKPPQIQ